MKDIVNPTAEVRQAEETEQQLVDAGKAIVSRDEGCKWELGRVASRWHQSYARGRTDADYAKMVGTSQQTVMTRRQVWERFQGSNSSLNLSWTHYRTALDWDDADEWLERAAEKSWSVQEMQEQRPSQSPHVSNNSGNNEWYTPAEYIHTVRQVLGEIDLDPASNKTAQKTVRAKRFYTQENNGLDKKWKGRVFMNPPYERGLVSVFTDKLVSHVEAGDVSTAVLLVNNATESQWFQEAARASAAICFPCHRIKYDTPDGPHTGSPLQGQAFMYFGEDVPKFAEKFITHGLCVRTR